MQLLIDLELWIANGLQSIIDQFGWLGVAGLMFFENATMLAPSEVILGMAGWFLVSRNQLPFSFIFLGGLYAAIGSWLGASLTYWVSRAGGRPMVEKIAGWFHISAHKIEQSEERFQRWGPGFVLFGRMVPGVRTLVSIPAGLARMPFGRFSLATLIGSYFWCTLLIGLGFWLGEEWEQIGALLQQYTWPVVGIALLLAAGFWWVKRKGKKNSG